MSGALALRNDQLDWTEAQKAALVQLGVGDAPRGDQLVFLHVSQQMGLDPFAKEIYMIGRWDPEAGKKRWTIQIGIDGFRSKSEEHPQFGGCHAPEWCGADGQWTDVWLADEPPKAARFTVYRKDQDKPIRCVALYKEYVQVKKDGKTPTHRWLTAPTHQLGKCAEALTRRTAFPRQLGAVYAPEELEHLDNPAPAPPVVIESQRADQPAEPDWGALIAEHEAARDPGQLWDLRKLAQGMRPNDGPLLNKIATAWQRAKDTLAAADAATQPPNKSQMNYLFKLLGEAGVKSDDARHRLAAHVLERDDVSFADFTASDVSQLINRLEALKAEGRLGAATPAEPPAARPGAENTGTGEADDG